jgi:WD40 repeat protein
MGVHIWDLSSGTLLRVLKGHYLFVWGLAFSPDGKFLISAGGDNQLDLRRGELFFWDPFIDQPPRTLWKDQGSCSSLSFSPDGRFLAVVLRGRDTDGGVPSKTLVYDWPSLRIRFTFVDVLDGRETHLAGPAGADLAFSPDSRWLALDGSGGTVRLYDLQSGTLVHTMRGHTHEVNAIVFSRDGRRLASASLDKLIKLWDASTGLELLSLRGHDGGVVSLAFTPDGHRLVSGGVDWTARVWDARPLRIMSEVAGK